jgi:CubicO group peptidase (beta-lactamase class C family)
LATRPSTASWWRRPSTSNFAESAARLVREAVAADEFSGVVAVAKDGEVIAEAAKGFADRAAGRKITVETRFATASVTKMFTAAAVARLADKGLVTFGAAVHDVLPKDWYPPALDEAATVHNLLTHTSNLPDYLPDLDPTTPDLWKALGSPTMRRATDFLPILRALPSGPPPAATAIYCDAGYLVLGLVLEAIAGVPYASAIATEVFEPCGMHDSAFLPFDELGHETAVGYLPPDAENRHWRTNVDLLPFAGAPDGGAFTTSRDLLKFFLAVHGSGLLSDATRRAVLSRWALDAAGDTGFGYGQRIIGGRGRTWYGHTGEDPGVSARAFHSPADGVSLVVLSNVRGSAGSRFWRLADSLPPIG